MPDIVPAADTALLEQQADAYLRSQGLDPAQVRTRTDPEARTLLKAAHDYASGCAAYVNAHTHFMRALNAGK